MCGPHHHFPPLLPHTLQRIPQAVGVVAAKKYANEDGTIDFAAFQYRKR